MRLLLVRRAILVFGFWQAAPLPSILVALAAVLVHNNNNNSNMPSSRRMKWIQRCREPEEEDHAASCHSGNCEDRSVPAPSQLDQQQQQQSLQRLAESMQLSVSELYQRHADYETAVQALQVKLRNPHLSGTVKHQLHCQHRFQYGRQPLVCPTCWSYLPICLCRSRKRRQSLPVENVTTILPEKWGTGGVKNNYDCAVVIWTHHKEWGSPSNTSSALADVLGPSKCRMLMKGLEEHDAELQRLLSVKNNAAGGEDRRVVVHIVLWTESTVYSSTEDNDDTDNNVSEKRQFFKADQLRQELLKASSSTTSSLSRDQHGSSDDPPVLLLLIALEGTWGQARRMSNKLPASVSGLSLTTKEIFGWRCREDDSPTTALLPQKSILQPLRKQITTRNQTGDIVDAGKVCTAEAVVSALLALSILNKVEAASLLDIAEQKVKDTAAYQGHAGMRMTSSS